MAMISSTEVNRRIRTYFDGGVLRYLHKKDAKLAEMAVRAGESCQWKPERLEELTFRKASEHFIKEIPEYPGGFAGTGIIICAGGIRYLTCAWVCISMLRKVSCRLPIEIWHIGKRELSPEICTLMAKHGVVFKDATELRGFTSGRILNGWPLKAYAILHCRFENVFLLDADNVPVRDPEYLIRSRQFKETGAIFWPDFGRLGPSRSIWRICGVRYKDESEFESGQILVNKARCWRALSLALWYNEHADYYYQHIHGDKETFHMAFRKVKQPYSMTKNPIEPLQGVMCQHDFDGNRIFQHRNMRKWDLHGLNPKTAGFLFEEECLEFLRDLRLKLNQRTKRKQRASESSQLIA
jgi:hypothetical protein